MLRLLVTLLLVLAGVARADSASRIEPILGERSAGTERSLPRLGLVFDAGVPGGLSVLLQGRLVDGLRIQAGPMWSGIGFGAKGGAVVAPLRGRFSPTLELEGGYGFRADVSFLARRSDVPDELRPVLARVSYWYVGGFAGVDLGSPSGVSFFVRGGLSHLQAHAPRTVKKTSSGGSLEIGDSTLRATVPSVKLGVQVWF